MLDFDTYSQGKGSTIKRIVSGVLHSNSGSDSPRRETMVHANSGSFQEEPTHHVPKHNNFGIAAVSNIGADTNWTGHLLAQSNLYGYGRLAWNPDLSADEIADEWVRLTFNNKGKDDDDTELISTIKQMLLDSWNIYESYTAPLGSVGWSVPITTMGPM